MASRSWMAAWLLAAGLIAPARADDQRGKTPPASPGTSRPSATAPADDQPGTTVAESGNTVKLDLRIAGLTPLGCDVEIKPAHPGCSFSKVTNKHVKADGLAIIELKDVRTLSPDRDCSIAITIREPGRGERTVHRGLRLRAPGVKESQLMSCWLSSPSRLARNAEGTTAKR